MADVKLNLAPLKRFAQAIVRRDGAIRKALLQWAVIYRTAMQERFSTYSRGGGNWKPLKPSTIRGRRGGNIAILFDTGALFGALEPRFSPGTGAKEELTRDGIRVGFGGPARHPKGKATIAAVATFHQFGNEPVLPKREILVVPPAATMHKLAVAMEAGMGAQWTLATAG